MTLTEVLKRVEDAALVLALIAMATAFIAQQ